MSLRTKFQLHSSKHAGKPRTSPEGCLHNLAEMTVAASLSEGQKRVWMRRAQPRSNFDVAKLPNGKIYSAQLQA
eukprot:1526535-Amphidinium_carterae.1